jgi:3',5'-cyclic AMP phosphodiesterase CpdA
MSAPLIVPSSTSTAHRSVRRWIVAALLTLVAGAQLPAGPQLPAQARPKAPPAADPLTLPLKDGSLRVAVIGDSGTGGSEQRQIAERMIEWRERFPFELVLMLGDNLYGDQEPTDFVNKFERPYKELLDAGVKFYASLGNHDERSQRMYKPFNMDGRFYYSFSPARGIRFFALDSGYPDREQLVWLEKELSGSTDRWKIAFFHHPIYSSGDRHGSNVPLRNAIEPIFLKHGVSAVFSGHEHFYERLHPQNGITYFTSGAAAKLRKGNINEGSLTAKGFDTDYSFMLLEFVEDEMHFQVVSRASKSVDSGVVRRREVPTTAGQPQ